MPLCVRRSASTHNARQSLPSLAVGFRALFATFRCGRLRSAPKSSAVLRPHLHSISPTPSSQPPLVVSQVPSKKEKERYAKREMRSSVRSAEYTTAHRLHYLRGRLGSGSSCCACALVVTDDSKKLRRPHRLSLRRHAAPTRNRRLQLSNRPL